MALTSRTITVHGLSDNDHRVLDAVTGTARTVDGCRWQAQATVSFVDRLGFAHHGPVRCARRHPEPGQVERFEVVVAGAVFSVTREEILSVVWGIPVPGYGEPGVLLPSEQGKVLVDPARAGSLGLVPWDLTVKSEREERAEIARGYRASGNPLAAAETLDA